MQEKWIVIYTACKAGQSDYKIQTRLKETLQYYNNKYQIHENAACEI